MDPLHDSLRPLGTLGGYPGNDVMDPTVVGTVSR